MSKPGGTRRRRIGAAAVLSAALLVPLGVFGGTSFASSSAAARQYKITICHHTHSKKHPTVTIRISNKAWPAHQKHGDTQGACPAPAKHGKHSEHHGKNDQHHGKNDQHHGKSDDQHGKSGNAGTQGQTQSGQQGKSGDHANDHANENAKGHGK